MLLPIGRAEEKARASSILVYGLIIANILVFLMELVGGDSFISGSGSCFSFSTNGSRSPNTTRKRLKAAWLTWRTSEAS